MTKWLLIWVAPLVCENNVCTMTQHVLDAFKANVNCVSRSRQLSEIFPEDKFYCVKVYDV